MYRKAIVCTDLSTESDSLIGCTQGLRVLGVQEVVLAHVVDVFDAPASRLGADGCSDDVFGRQVQALEASGIKVRVEALMGHPAFSVREACRLHEASLIVVASHGTGVNGLPFSGSVSSDLILLSETPVFVASFAFLTEEEGQACGRDVLSHVLYATDFSKAAERAFETLLSLAREGAPRITLMHVQDKNHIVRTSDRDASETLAACDRTDSLRLGKLREQLLDAGAAKVDVDLLYGSPHEVIAERVSSGEYSLALLGARGRSPKAEAVLGGVSNEALRSTRTPILIVPPAVSSRN